MLVDQMEAPNDSTLKKDKMIDEWEKVYPAKKEEMKGENPHYFIKAEEDGVKRERAKELRTALNDQVNKKD